MKTFYSRNKKDEHEEISKIEQRRYEDIILQERSNRKKGILSVKSSLENLHGISNYSKSGYKRIATVGSNPETKQEITSFAENPSKSTTPKKADRTSSLPPIPTGLAKISVAPKLPALQALNKISTRSKKSKLKPAELKLFQQELTNLALEEAKLEESLAKLDSEVQKKQAFKTLQTIDEDTRELEESLNKLILPIKMLQSSNEVNQENLAGLPRNPGVAVTTSEVVNKKTEAVSNSEKCQDPHNPTESSPSKSTTNQEVRNVSPDPGDFHPDQKSKVTRRSVYSEKSTSSKYALRGSKNPKPRFISRDYVRVNPNVNIKSLLYA